MTKSPPDNPPFYRLLTGKDDAALCHRALALGYKLHGSPAMAYGGDHAIVAQALVWHRRP